MILERVTAMAASDAMIVSPDLDTQKTLGGLLVKYGMAPILASTVGEAEIILENCQVSVILSSEQLPDGGFGDILGLSKKDVRSIPVIVFSPFADWRGYLKIVGAGAFDYFRYPPDRGEIERIVRNALCYEPVQKAKSAASAA
jgi:DNA-binding NtrC family response regulator